MSSTYLDKNRSERNGQEGSGVLGRENVLAQPDQGVHREEAVQLLVGRNELKLKMDKKSLRACLEQLLEWLSRTKGMTEMNRSPKR